MDLNAPLDRQVVADRQGVPRTWLTLAIFVVLATVVGVFVAPWLVHGPVRPVASESQALGFYNRVALVSLALGTLAMVAIGLAMRRWARSEETPAEPGVSHEMAGSAERVDVRVAVACMLGIGAMVCLVALMYQRHPVSDSAYFVDRVLRVANGDMPYRDFEFAYGPLLLFPVVWLWQAVRWLGVEIYPVYFAVAAAVHVLGIAMTVYLVNRLRLPRGWKNWLVLLVFGFDLFSNSLGLNYTPVRFLTPVVLLVWALGVARRNTWWGLGAAVAAVAVAFSVSPEMGVATTAGVVVALGLMASDKRPLLFGVAAVTLLEGLAGWAVFARFGGTFASFSSGAYYLPVLPGQPAILFVATMLLLGWSVGRTFCWTHRSELATQVGWFCISVVLLTAAIGRADLGHLFWNGLPAILLTVAVLHQSMARLLPAYFGAVFIVFVVASFTYAVEGAPLFFAGAVNSGLVSSRSAASVATWLGRPGEAGLQWYRDAEVVDPDPSLVAQLIREGHVFAPFGLAGQVGPQLAEAHALVPAYAIWDTATRPNDIYHLLRPLGSANSVLLPKRDYEAIMNAPRAQSPAEIGGMRRPRVGADVAFYLQLEQFPLWTQAVNPVFMPAMLMRRTLGVNWVVSQRSGGYVVLRRRAARH